MLEKLRDLEKAMGSNLIERRRHQRLRLQIPLFIRGKDNYGAEFLELAKTLDIGGSGARLISPHHLRLDEIISLTIPAPLPSSPGAGDSGTPPIHARVLRIASSGDLEFAAVEFLRPID
jgi:hypothetical protein